MEKALALKHYRILYKSLPKHNRITNKHLYKCSFSTNLLDFNPNLFLKEYEQYVDSCKKYNVFYKKSQFFFQFSYKIQFFL